MAIKKKTTFEEKLGQLESYIADMESGALSLEDSMKHYEEGIKLIAEMEHQLQTATQRLTILRSGNDGDIEEPFSPEADA